jgi:transcription elongation GreA/GreB family factor
MRLPIRKSEILQSTTKVTDNFVSAEKIKHYKNELEDLIKNQRPPAVKEVQRTAEMGDFSENAAYQMAKGRLRQINYRITTLEEKIKSAVVIDPDHNTSGKIQIGSTVTLEVGGRQFVYQILGSQETNPGHGYISYLSPIGAALIDHRIGDEVVVDIQGRKIIYKIIAKK